HLFDLRALDEPERKVARGQLHGLAIGEHASPPNEHLVAPSQAESLGDASGGWPSLDLHLGGWFTAGGSSVAEECTLPSFALMPAKALMTEPSQGWSGPDEHASAVLDIDQPLGSEHSDGLPYGHPRGLVSLHEHPLGGQLRTGSKLTSGDSITELVGDLSVDRAVAASINAVCHVCPRSLSSPLPTRHGGRG
ncbi:MAG TPA: hypothetical protein VGJ95_04040, partial [Pseudonocardiaceae bacterium]